MKQIALTANLENEKITLKPFSPPTGYSASIANSHQLKFNGVDIVVNFPSMTQEVFDNIHGSREGIMELEANIYKALEEFFSQPTYKGWLKNNIS